MKMYRLTKVDGKVDNYVILTQQQLDLELPMLVGPGLFQTSNFTYDESFF